MILNLERGLTIGYNKRAVATVTENLAFQAGQVSLLLGLNGQGKTTLMKTLARLLPPVTGKVARTRVLYLSDDVDFPANLTPIEIVNSIALTPIARGCGLEMLEDLEVENKRYGVLSKGNRQKARIVFGEVGARSRNVNFLGMDEPFAGLDFQAREYLASRWLQYTDQDRHLLVSMHPSEIPVQPSQILLVSQGQIWTVPPSTPWAEIRATLGKPKEVLGPAAEPVTGSRAAPRVLAVPRPEGVFLSSDHPRDDEQTVGSRGQHNEEVNSEQ
jgi:ABC-type multidrug transport system ATPase subunit